MLANKYEMKLVTTTPELELSDDLRGQITWISSVKFGIITITVNAVANNISN